METVRKNIDTSLQNFQFQAYHSVGNHILYRGFILCCRGTASVTSTVPTNTGTYSSSTGLSINPATGYIDIGASAVGTYIVTYTFGASFTSTRVRINKIGNNQIDYTNGSQTISSTVNEHSNAILTAPAGTVFIKFNFASHGLPTGISPALLLVVAMLPTASLYQKDISLDKIQPQYQQKMKSTIRVVFYRKK